MNVTINEKEVVALAVAQFLSHSTLEKIAERLIEKAVSERIELLTVKQAAQRLKMSEKTFRTLGLPIVNIGEKKHRYRLSDIEAKIKEVTE